ncbi:MAG: nucleotidyltransferase domain-containing protein [Bacteroidetes bacterium]|nr:MAG: nucleotidyltransferase domain-containing protein [Bacteroidota bacterium]
MNTIKENIILNESLLNQVKKAVTELEPDADVFLFGSRAKGDVHSESDWDFLVLVPGILDYERKRKILDALFEVELSSGEIFNDIIKSKEFWKENKLLHASPFYKNLTLESVSL